MKNLNFSLHFTLLLVCVMAARKSFSAENESGVLATEEEKVVIESMHDGLVGMNTPAAHILKGTLLYLMYPRKSKYRNTNSLGFRGDEVKPKKKNGYNIMLMGGSTVFGAYQSDSKTIPALLEQLLREKHPDRDIHVYNLGISGYVFQREVALVKWFRRKLDPDLVIFYHGGNDFTSGYHGYMRYQPFNEEEETFFVKKQLEGDWVAAVRSLVENARKRIRVNRRKVKSYSYHKLELQEKVDAIADGYLEDAKDVTKYLGSEGHFRRKGIPVLFVIQPNIFTRKNKTPREQKIVDTRERPDYLDFVRQSIAKIDALTKAEGITIHDFTGALDEYEGELYRDEIHINTAGNRIIVEKLANLIEEGGYIGAIKK